MRAWTLYKTIPQHLNNARNRPCNALADVLAQPGHRVGGDSAAMLSAFWIEKKHQSKADTRADSKTFLHNLLREKLLGISKLSFQTPGKPD